MVFSALNGFSGLVLNSCTTPLATFLDAQPGLLDTQLLQVYYYGRRIYARSEMADSTLGTLEMQILQILEELGECDVNQVRDKLEANGHDVAYTTVMTVLGRLFEKSTVSRHKEGRKFVYSFTKRSARTKMRFLETIKTRLFGNEKLAAIVSFLDVDNGLSKDDLHKLREIVERKIADQEKRR